MENSLSETAGSKIGRKVRWERSEGENHFGELKLDHAGADRRLPKVGVGSELSALRKLLDDQYVSPEAGYLFDDALDQLLCKHRQFSEFDQECAVLWLKHEMESGDIDPWAVSLTLEILRRGAPAWQKISDVATLALRGIGSKG